MNIINYIDITMNTISVIICILILFFVTASEHRKLKLSRIFIQIITVQIIILLMIILKNIFDINILPENTIIIKILFVLIPLGGPVIIILFINLILNILNEKTTVSKAALITVNIAVFLCLIDILITIILLTITLNTMADLTHHLLLNELGSWFLLSQILSLICIAISIGLFITYKKYLSKREFLTLLSYAVLPTAAILLELYIWNLALVNFSITLTIFIYYASIQSELSQQIKQNKVSIMLSQIQPHFLYNALSAIAVLCKEDPDKAQKATIDFSMYLRSNMESLDVKLISIEKELNHVKGYLELEKAIYEETLNIEYNIETLDFLLPPLTIQPIVENAVKHGIGKNENGGTIIITVSHTVKEFIITVTDNGAGFDPKAPCEDGRKRTGIDNVKRRLKEQCSGTLDITSQKEKGTTVFIKIPKNKEQRAESREQ